jgi:hypothetical protein
MYQFGWRPRKKYFVKQYNMDEDDFDVAETPGGGTFSRQPAAAYAHPAGCPCGCHDRKRTPFGLFASKDEKTAAKDERLMREFSDLMLASGQDALDAAVESYADALGTVKNFDGAAAALEQAYRRRDAGTFAGIIDEVRYAAAGIGGARRRGGKHG